MMQEPYLVFEAGGYHFAVIMSVVDNVSEETHEDSVSFSSRFLDAGLQSEPCCIVLNNGKSIKVQAISDIAPIKDTILPLPGYLFEREAGLVRGVLWTAYPRIIVLNETFLLETI